MTNIWRSIWRRLWPAKRSDTVDIYADSSIKSYEWTQVSGPATHLSTTGTGQATFTPTEPGAYVFKFRVQYEDGSTDTDEVTIRYNGEED